MPPAPVDYVALDAPLVPVPVPPALAVPVALVLPAPEDVAVEPAPEPPAPGICIDPGMPPIAPIPPG